MTRLDSISLKCLKKIEKCLFYNENNDVLNGKNSEEKPCINRESKSLDLTIQLYRFYDEHEDPSSCNTVVYLSWLLRSEDALGVKVHR